jgi:hypothetical protein
VLLQTTWLPTAFINGVGLTVIEKLTGKPEQPAAVGVTVNTPVIAEVPVLVTVKVGILDPVPDAA